MAHDNAVAEMHHDATAAAAAAAAPAPLRRLSDLPGPRGWPLVGSLPDIKRSQVHRNVEAWAAEHGPIFRFQIGRRHFLALCDHELIAAVLRDRPDGFRRTERLEAIGREMGLQAGVFGSNGDEWRRQRRLVMAGLDPAKVRAYHPALQKVAARLQARWSQAARDGQAIDLQPELMRYTVDAITGLAFGSDVNTLESDDDVIQQHLDKIFPSLFRRMFSPLPYWRWIKLPADRRLEHGVAEVHKAIAGFIAQARQRLHDEPSRREHPPNLLEAMIVATAAPDSQFNDEDVAGNVMNMLLAGEDTTANTLAWMLHLLARHPAALEQASEEARRVAAAGANASIDQLDALEYIEACIHETMRLKPVAPFNVLQALRDTVIADVQVPAGTLVWLVIRHDSLRGEHFADARRFQPQRWLAHGRAEVMASAAKRVSMPFGAGPRVCPGRYLALLEMKLAMATLLNAFDIVAVDAPGGGEAAESMAFTMAPAGLSMRLRLRSQ
jgi:cytochrome P450